MQIEEYRKEIERIQNRMLVRGIITEKEIRKFNAILDEAML